MPIRLKDIASDLGVSAMTVSKVLRNQGCISQATREKILKRIKELGYQPNLTARTLVSGRSFLVGLIVPDLMHPFFAALAKGLSRQLRAKGYGLAISSFEDDPEIERQEIATFLARRVDALILASAQRSKDAFKRLEKEGVPFVLADRLVSGIKAHFVGSDDQAIGALATEHLIERGYRRIAHIRLRGISTGDQRFQGYRAALKRHKSVTSPQWIVNAESADERGEECGFKAMRQLLALKNRPDAVFCYNDVIAYGALKAILEKGLRIPSDVTVIGVSNLASLAFWDASPVALSTIDQNIPEPAARTAQLVLQLIEQGSRKRTERYLLAPRLILRSST